MIVSVLRTLPNCINLPIGPCRGKRHSPASVTGWHSFQSRRTSYSSSPWHQPSISHSQGALDHAILEQETFPDDGSHFGSDEKTVGYRIYSSWIGCSVMCFRLGNAYFFELIDPSSPIDSNLQSGMQRPLSLSPGRVTFERIFCSRPTALGEVPGVPPCSLGEESRSRMILQKLASIRTPHMNSPVHRAVPRSLVLVMAFIT